MIDREALVRRHTVELTEPDAAHALTVGNGDFAYTADITGMQTFTAFHRPVLGGQHGPVVNTTTMSTWGWHEMPNPDGFVLSDAMSAYDTARGPIEYPDRYDMRGAAPHEYLLFAAAGVLDLVATFAPGEPEPGERTTVTQAAADGWVVRHEGLLPWP